LTDDKATSPTQEVWLLGQPPLRRLLDYVERHAKPAHRPTRFELVEQWRAANDHYLALAETEARLADRIEVRALDTHLAPLVEEVRADARFRRTFDALPTRFALVELDKLVVYQTHVRRTFLGTLAQRLRNGADPRALFRFCLPLEQPHVPVKIERAGGKRFVIRSESTDLRFHRAELWKPDQLRDYESFGPVVAAIGLVVGFGSNFLNAIQDDDSGRLLLHNGYHRACALRELGITHAPCIVQTVSRRDELDISADGDVSRSPAFYFNAPRPPMLKDFFDPKIRRAIDIERLAQVVEISFEIKDYLLTDESTPGSPSAE
jgi:hypothetical protein